MSTRLQVDHETFDLKNPFTISRGTKTRIEVVVVRLTRDGVRGRGEGTPYARYGEFPDDAVKTVLSLGPHIAAGMDRDALRSLLTPGAARNALDCAFWDMESKLTGRPVWALADLPKPEPVVTAETIGLNDVDAMAEAASKAKTRPLLKIKVGVEDIVPRVKAVRAAAPSSRLIVDPNESWNADILRSVAPALADLGVEMIEQPLPASKDAVLSRLSIPIDLCADESVHDSESLATVQGRYQMVNIKLDKTGGLTEAIRLAHIAQDLGLKIMIGCMVSTSLSMAAAMMLTPYADLVDLDGPMWLAADRMDAVKIENGYIHPPERALWG